jgi:hypothetical protein
LAGKDGRHGRGKKPFVNCYILAHKNDVKHFFLKTFLKMPL